MFETLDLSADLGRYALDEHQLAHGLGRALVRAAVEQRAQLREARAPLVAQFGEKRVERVDVLRARRILDALAPLHLLHQERRLHRRVVLRADIDAAQVQQVRRPLERIAQRLICLVRARRPLHGDALLRVAGGGEAIRVHLRLHGAVRGVERRLVERESRRQMKEIEVAVLQRNHRVVALALNSLSTAARRPKCRPLKRRPAPPLARPARSAVTRGTIRRSRTRPLRSDC
ncbi:hypothetical protein BURPS1710b_2730 [Burkholderia pseudomallei 1710b]|uniref:Uncharacterized protein n=1 Tax=Burkholderia pseudomallei (strain 1710b) TaxID=320372 RepID=Q3JQN7_BURP1|nr:hypothetical protein BURPS1710b_2730 [Burkholderia pseudomallei 1710b]